MTENQADGTRPAWDFFTLGYASRTLDEVLDVLSAHGIATLVDVRRDPVSRFRPQFNRKSLAAALPEHGIDYLHLPELGIPREVRTRLASNPAEFARWYDTNVVPLFLGETYPRLRATARSPLAFMCAEKDPAGCHRSRLAAALEGLGLRGMDI